MQGVVDDVLFQLKGSVENVIAGRPTDFDAVGGGQALFADGQALQPFQVFRPEHSGRGTVDAAACEGDAAGEETHDATSTGTRCGGARTVTVYRQEGGVAM